MSWGKFAESDPNLAEFGAARLAAGVAYLATVRKDGAPRVHPVTPIIGHGRLFVFMEPTSRKGDDLRRDGRYALHCAVADNSGGEGEFYIYGTATSIEDAATRALAAEASSHTPKDRYVLFELDVDSAFSNLYDEVGNTFTMWKAEAARDEEAE